MALTVNFKNYDGTILQTLEVESGATPAYTGDTPEKPAGDHVRYAFSGWDPEPAAITADQDYVAQYSEIPTAFITFVDYDDTVISGPTEYDVGTQVANITVPADPTREATQQYTYAFAGWDPVVADVAEDATYKATYNATVNQYSVTFVDDDGETVLKEATDYNYDTPFASVEQPDVPDKQKEGQDDIVYRFDHWTPEPAAVTDDVVYQAVYKVIKAAGFKVTFTDEDGFVLAVKEYSYGETPAFDGPENFAVTYDPEIAEVTDDATYEVTLTKMYEVLRKNETMGPGYNRAHFLVGEGYDENDLPDWPAVGSTALFEGDEATCKYKAVDGTWQECTDTWVLLLNSGY